MSLSLDCCGLTPASPSLISAQGFSLKQNLSHSTLRSTTSVSLGFSLSGPSPASAFSVPPAPGSLPLSADTSCAHDSTNSSLKSSDSRPSFLSSFVRWTGFGHSSPTLPSSPPDIKIIGPKHFQKYAKGNAESVCLLCFSPHLSQEHINASSLSSFEDLGGIEPLKDSSPPVDATDHLKFIPEKLIPWATSVFSPSKFDRLPPHWPYDVDIELEEGKTPPFGPRLYCLTPAEHDALSEHLATNLKQGHIRRSTSLAAAPVLFIHKKTG